MKKFYAAEPKKGMAEQWVVGVEKAVKIETEQFENRSGMSIRSTSKDGAVDIETFGKDGFVVATLPVGQWQWERSSDGRNWSKICILESIQLRSGPSQAINFSLDGQAPYARVWGRYTRLVPAAVAGKASSSTAVRSSGKVGA